MSQPVRPVPYAEIDTLFLDVGNTLISIDFDRVSTELATRAFHCGPEALRRAEATARPGYSERVFVTGVPAHRSLFHWYLTAILENTEALAAVAPADLDALVAEIGPILRPDGRASALWRMVMPGVPEALERLRRCGLTLAVISNSDGTCAQSLEAAELAHHFSCVIDSAVVGVEKPHRRIFEIALARCGADPQRTLYVGDIYHADVLGPRAAGLHALLLGPYGDWPPLDCERAPDLLAIADRFEETRRRS